MDARRDDLYRNFFEVNLMFVLMKDTHAHDKFS
jgi:hypothetical protein